MALIKSLTVRKFRGILDSTLLLDGKSLVLHGENGHGKSSFVDALEFFFKGEVSHLQGAEGVSLDRHGPHALHTRDASRVTIEFAGTPETVSRSFGGLDKLPASLTSHLALGAEASFILRRRNLLGFIAARAADRYGQLAELIGITDLDAVDLNLKRQSDNVVDEVQAAQGQVQASLTNLKTALGQKVDADATILAALNAKLIGLEQRPLATLAEIEKRKAEIVAGAKSPSDLSRSVALQTAKSKVESVRGSLAFLDKHAPFWVNLAAFQQDTAAVRDQVYRSVLTQAANLLQSQRPITCPVCQRPFDTSLPLDVVIARTQTRLAALQATSEKATKLQTTKNALRTETELFVKSLRESRGQIQTHLPQMKLDTLTAVENGLLVLYRTLEADVTQLRLEASADYLPLDRRAACAATLDRAIGQLHAMAQQTAPTDKDRLAVKGIEMLALVATERAALRCTQRDVAAKSAKYAVIAAIYAQFLQIKRTEVQRIFDDLQQDIRRFYDVIHPGERHRAVSLVIPPDRRASAHIKMGFYNRPDEDPRGFNSEAHLDSLELCIFLAFTKRFNGGFPLVVLDDVVSSVDAAHRGRICRLLCDEFPDVQLLVTTHDYVWLEEWEAHQCALNLTNRFINMRILNWSLDHGPTLDKYKPRWESLQEKLTAGDREGAASEGRRILEWLLLELCLNTEAPVALTRDGKYTVSQLYTPLLLRLKKLNKDIQDGNAAIFQDLQINGIFGNLLAHNNTRAGNASMAEVQDFASAVTAFHGLFYCAACKQLVKYDRNDNELKCRCRARLWNTR